MLQSYTTVAPTAKPAVPTVTWPSVRVCFSDGQDVSGECIGKIEFKIVIREQTQLRLQKSSICFKYREQAYTLCACVRVRACQHATVRAYMRVCQNKKRVSDEWQARQATVPSHEEKKTSEQEEARFIS